MAWLLLILSVAGIAAEIVINVGKRQKKSKRIIREGQLQKSEMVSRDGEMFYVEVIALVRSFKPIPVDEFESSAASVAFVTRLFSGCV